MADKNIAQHILYPLVCERPVWNNQTVKSKSKTAAALQGGTCSRRGATLRDVRGCLLVFHLMLACSFVFDGLVSNHHERHGVQSVSVPT